MVVIEPVETDLSELEGGVQYKQHPEDSNIVMKYYVKAEEIHKDVLDRQIDYHFQQQKTLLVEVERPDAVADENKSEDSVEMKRGFFEDQYQRWQKSKSLKDELKELGVWE